VGLLEIIIEESDMTHDSLTIGQQARFLRVAKMPVNVLLIHRQVSGGTVREQAVNCLIWFGIRIRLCHLLCLPQL